MRLSCLRPAIWLKSDPVSGWLFQESPLRGWLQSQLPAAPSSAHAAVMVLLGRGPATSSAAVELRRDPSLSAYVSGDARSTAERLVQLGVAPSRIAGDSCEGAAGFTRGTDG